MKIHALAAATALLSLGFAAPVVAQADEDEMTYPRVTHCAALNIVLGQVLAAGADKDKAEVKAQSETYLAQAAALAVVAAFMHEKDPESVQKEVFAQTESLVKSFSDEAAAEAMLERDFGACTDMGKAAYEAVQDAQKS